MKSFGKAASTDAYYYTYNSPTAQFYRGKYPVTVKQLNIDKC